jgi:hypothetical protein
MLQLQIARHSHEAPVHAFKRPSCCLYINVDGECVVCLRVVLIRAFLVHILVSRYVGQSRDVQ